ncbi:MAG: tryptophan halogenase [Alteromonadaceae bacterium]|nr:MAG: tryptophan halogenase [Alteromonadaceae bacterium]
MNEKIKKIVIVGGGTAGWMTAARLSKAFTKELCEIHLIESPDIPTVGVGEATIPHVRHFNTALEIDDDEFVKHTQGTFKLGIEFVGWGKPGERYMHAFGDLGRDMLNLHFHHFWQKMHAQGKAEPFGAYSYNTAAAYQNRFMRSIEAGNSPLSNITYAYQFDANLYADFLRDYALKRGVTRTEATVAQVNLNANDGFISGVSLNSGEQITGDFFVDCSGFKALLIDKALGVDFVDWSEYLPCDRAWAVACENKGELKPYTQSIAQPAGWQWRIPLQHRTGNGHVFSSKFMAEDEAREILLNNLDGKALAEPRLLKFKAGKREKFWHKNCVAIGLSSGFLEPLESTSIHLIQTAIDRLLAHFPDRNCDPTVTAHYNENTHREYDSVRDFLILHYHVNQRDDSDFWRYCRNMKIPDTLKARIDLFRASGQIYCSKDDLFSAVSWVEVLLGQNITPQSYHPLVDSMAESDIALRLERIKGVVDASVEHTSKHAEYIQRTCAAKN